MKTSECAPTPSVEDFPKGKIDVVVTRNELTVYAARLMRAEKKAGGQPVAVVATRPQVPIVGMEEALGQQIFWIHDCDVTSWKALELPVSKLLFHPGKHSS